MKLLFIFGKAQKIMVEVRRCREGKLCVLILFLGFVQGCGSTFDEIDGPQHELHEGGLTTSQSTNPPYSPDREVLTMISTERTRRFFTTSTTQRPRELSEDEIMMNKYCSLLRVRCDEIGLSGNWFIDLLRHIRGKGSLQARIALNHKHSRQTLGSHVTSNLTTPHCGVSRTLAALTVMRDFHADQNTRDVAVHIARVLMDETAQFLCDTSVFQMIYEMLGPESDGVALHNIHIAILKFVTISPGILGLVRGVVRSRQENMAPEFVTGLLNVIQSELGEAMGQYPRYRIDALRNRILML